LKGGVEILQGLTDLSVSSSAASSSIVVADIPHSLTASGNVRFTINWNKRSRSSGFSVHDPPERAPWRQGLCYVLSGMTDAGSTSRALAHRKAAISRAIAVIATVLPFPFAVRRR
jgi:hypothetical protein